MEKSEGCGRSMERVARCGAARKSKGKEVDEESRKEREPLNTMKDEEKEGKEVKDGGGFGKGEERKKE